MNIDYTKYLDINLEDFAARNGGWEDLKSTPRGKLLKQIVTGGNLSSRAKHITYHEVIDNFRSGYRMIVINKGDTGRIFIAVESKEVSAYFVFVVERNDDGRDGDNHYLILDWQIPPEEQALLLLSF